MKDIIDCIHLNTKDDNTGLLLQAIIPSISNEFIPKILGNSLTRLLLLIHSSF